MRAPDSELVEMLKRFILRMDRRQDHLAHLLGQSRTKFSKHSDFYGILKFPF